MKYLNSYNGAVTEGFFDFFKKPNEQTLKKRELLRVITECCHNGLSFYNSNYNNQQLSTDVDDNVDISMCTLKGKFRSGVNDILISKIPIKFGKVTGYFNCVMPLIIQAI